jgi:hypothetical protein
LLDQGFVDHDSAKLGFLKPKFCQVVISQIEVLPGSQAEAITHALFSMVEFPFPPGEISFFPGGDPLFFRGVPPLQKGSPRKKKRATLENQEFTHTASGLVFSK